MFHLRFDAADVFPFQGCKVKGISKAIDVGDEADNHVIDY